MRPDCKLSMGLRTVLCPTCHGTRVSGAQGPERDDYVYLIEEWVDSGEQPASTSTSATFGKGWPTS